MKGILRLAAAVFALIAVFAFSATAAAETNAAGAKAKAAIKSFEQGQKQILEKQAIKVTVKAQEAGKVKLKGASKSFDNPKFTKLTKPKTLKFSKRAKKTAKLKLTAKGRKAVAACGALTIKISAGTKSKTGKLTRNSKTCKPKKIDLSRADDCNFIGSPDGLCLMPFPDDYYTVDAATATGKRINLTDAAMPTNVTGTPIASTPYNLNDGFSPGQAITLKVPGLDTPAALAQTDPTPLDRLGRNAAYSANSEPVVVIDATTGERWPIWVEIDSNSKTVGETALLIHPAVNFDARHRYIVALRDLKDASGATLAAPEGFRYYRDDLPSSKKPIKDQRKRFNAIFKTLRDSGVARSDLYLAWDFTVASDENIAGRLLHIRDDAFSQLGDTDLDDGIVQGATPAFTITSVDEDPNAELKRRIKGKFTVPCYLTNGCEAPARFTLDVNGKPTQQGTYAANFDCIVPNAAIASPGRPSVYGHGLLGSASEVGSSPQRTLAQTHNFVFCATDEIGFSNGDIANTVGILGDFSKFPELTDRTQQGLLNEMLLGRLMDNPSGFLSNAAFHADGVSTASAAVIDPSKLYYNGNSQGGILGGAFMAVSPDATRGSLGVPGMNYSVLLNRSVDFDIYSTILDPNYPSELAQPLILSLVQMLWDRSEANGYAHRMTSNPLPNTPAHEVLLNVAFGDHQVTSWQADVEARTIGAQAHAPVVYDGRWPGVDQLWNIPRITSYPYKGSAIVYWDGGPTRAGGTLGTDVPPVENIPNRSGVDPHGLPRAEPEEQQMVSDFLRPDALSNITDTCLGLPCFDGGFSFP